ncbi:capsular polysaccharide export protein, LipB/KpsS family [Paraburkholderia sediminicola]|uniref:capsular polysaccharide export protein, LipB/KpsS family n=1 Tax=Paraburkholderia sediminicola TaxID=458836 RepID=UPI0038BC8E0B
MILVLVDSMERYSFFRRLISPIKSEARFLFVTTEPLAHLLLIARGFRSVYVNRRQAMTRKYMEEAEATNFRRSIEILSGCLSEGRAKKDAASIIGAIRQILSGHDIEACLLWNGQQLAGRVLTYLCDIHGIRRRVMEISNLPNKLFVDSQGVNALSTIGDDPSILDELTMPDEQKHVDWLAEYERYKASPLPQSAVTFSKKAKRAANYALKYPLGGACRTEFSQVRRRGRGKTMFVTGPCSLEELQQQRYMFLPLQVSSDTQIKLHSDVDNIDAIRIAAGKAKGAALRLVVKIHPAETDVRAINEIVSMRKNFEFEIVTLPTNDLIRYADEVVTINSTVGLEALLYGKRVTCLGRCFYVNFDRARLLKYIHGYLTDGIDYFGGGNISARAARSVCGLLEKS